MEHLTVPMKGFKVFNPDWTCRDKQYTCPGEFKEDVKPMPCDRGMHFCPDLKDCFNYYAHHNRVATIKCFAKGETL